MTSNNPFHNAMNNNIYTSNGAVSNHTADITGNAEGRLAWFFKGIRDLNFVYAAQYLQQASQENLVDTFCLVMNTRDVLHGKGERMLGRKAFQWLLINFPDEMERIVKIIPDYGRWDDLYVLFPKYLKLDDLTWVNSNYCSNIDIKKLRRAQEVQHVVIRIFANQLYNDYKNMKEGKPVTLAAKWAETEGSTDDKKYNLVQQICSKLGLHPKGYRVRNTQLREYINIVERLCCNKEWDKIDYSKVPSQCMTKLRKAFVKNDSERFQEYLRKLSSGDKSVKINAKTLHPHELIGQYLNINGGWHGTVSKTVDTVIEEQWKELERITEEFGALEKTVVLSDVSGSMYCNKGLPLLVCIALSLLIAKVSKSPWNGSVMAFSEYPEWAKIKGTTLRDRIDSIKDITQGFNTNFEAVFDHILTKYEQYKLKPDDMPDKIICISDMQFDAASSNRQTNLSYITKKFTDRGLKRPKLIFWNVNSGLDFPATEQDQDTCLIGGFSPSILKSLMQTGSFTPMTILRETIDDVRYDPIRQKLQNISNESGSSCCAESGSGSSCRAESASKEYRVIEEDYFVVGDKK